MKPLLLGLVIAAASCAPSTPVPQQAESATVEAQDTALASLAGEWRVAGIDGQPFDEPYGLALSADDRQIWWSPKCAGFVRSYALKGPAARFAPVERPRANDGNPAPVCLIAVPARLGEAFAALDAAERAVRTPANGVEISGGGHSLLLFSQ